MAEEQKSLPSQTSSQVEAETHQDRARQIYDNVFEEVFASNCGNPLSLEQVKTAFQMKLGDSCTEELENDLERFFYGADENNDGSLDKTEIRNFILESLQRGRFQQLFEAEDMEMMKLVDQMFDWIFAQAFEDNGGDEIDILVYQDCITEKIEGDGMAQPMLDLFDDKTQSIVTQE